MKHRGIELIQQERTRQIEKEGYNLFGDKLKNARGELAFAAAYYAAGTKNLYQGGEIADCGKKGFKVKQFFPWEDEYLKLEKHDRIKQLQIAGALIAAEIDRLLANVI